MPGAVSDKKSSTIYSSLSREITEDFLPNLPSSLSQDFSLESYGITVSFKGATLTYDSGLGNYRADLTSSSKIYKNLLGLLDSVDFSEGTGGHLKRYSDLLDGNEEEVEPFMSWGTEKDLH